MNLPSGEKTGASSYSGSFVRFRTAFDFRSRRKMSRLLPSIPENTMDVPSGDQDGASGTSGATEIRSRRPPPRAEKMRSLRPRSCRPKTAMRSPSGAKERSRPLSGPAVRYWPTMYSYFVVWPAERFL